MYRVNLAKISGVIIAFVIIAMLRMNFFQEKFIKQIFFSNLIHGPFRTNHDMTLEVTFDGFLLTYRLIAKGGFEPSKSRSENLLIIMVWAVIGARGHGSELFILEKRSAGLPRIIPVSSF